MQAKKFLAKKEVLPEMGCQVSDGSEVPYIDVRVGWGHLGHVGSAQHHWHCIVVKYVEKLLNLKLASIYR